MNLRKRPSIIALAVMSALTMHTPAVSAAAPGCVDIVRRQRANHSGRVANGRDATQLSDGRSARPFRFEGRSRSMQAGRCRNTASVQVRVRPCAAPVTACGSANTAGDAYSFAFMFYRYDASGVLLGSQKVTATLAARRRPATKLRRPRSSRNTPISPATSSTAAAPPPPGRGSDRPARPASCPNLSLLFRYRRRPSGPSPTASPSVRPCASHRTNRDALRRAEVLTPSVRAAIGRVDKWHCAASNREQLWLVYDAANQTLIKCDHEPAIPKRTGDRLARCGRSDVRRSGGAGYPGRGPSGNAGVAGFGKGH